MGYVLTVRPVFQYQLLQEQNARLELQNAAAQATLRETLAKQATAAQELTTLTSTVERTNRDREALERALHVERAREEAARKAAAASAGEAAAQVAAREETKGRPLSCSVIADQIAVTGNGDAKLTDSVWRSFADQYEKDFDGHFISDVKTSWPDPYKEIVASIDGLASHSTGVDAYPPKTVALFKTRLEKARSEFHCPAVDFDKMKAEFLTEVAATEPLVAQDVAAEVDKLKRSETNPFLRLVIDKGTLETLTRNARLERRGKIVRAYWDRLLTLHRECDGARLGLVLAMMGRADVLKGPP